MSITDVDIYCASVLNINEIAGLISRKCDINEKLDIVAKYKNKQHIINLCKRRTMYDFILENHTYLYLNTTTDEFEEIINIIASNPLGECPNIFYEFKPTPETRSYLLENIDRFKIVCDKMTDEDMLEDDPFYLTFNMYILRVCAMLNYNESYEYLYHKILSSELLKDKLNEKCNIGVYKNRKGNSTSYRSQCEYCNHKLTTYECILIQSLFHTHYMEKKEINHMNKNPQLFKRILSGDFVMNKKFIKILKECWNGVYFPYFANLIWKEHNINNGILEKLFDIFFEKSKTSDRERTYFESLGCIDLIIVMCIKSMKKQNLITYDAIKDIMKMEFYNYNKIGSYTKYFHSLGLIDINQIHIDEKDRIQHVMEKLII